MPGPTELFQIKVVQGLRQYWGFIGIMEKNMESTVQGLGCRVLEINLEIQDSGFGVHDRKGSSKRIEMIHTILMVLS